jgi:hypothetical protein
MRGNEMEIENTKKLDELHLQVGFVVQASQYMEMMISASLAALENKSAQALPDDEFNKKYELFGIKTLGKLCGLLKEKLDFTESQLALIKDAVDERNYVIHSIFTDPVQAITTDQGCTIAIERVLLAMKKIDPAVQILSKVVNDSLDNELNKVIS